MMATQTPLRIRAFGQLRQVEHDDWHRREWFELRTSQDLQTCTLAAL
jgi:hypothetical protein